MKTRFILADEIRPEASGKQTVLGLLPDNVAIIVIKPSGVEPPPADGLIGLDRLAFLVNLSDLPEGVHSFSANIIDPDGNKFPQDIPLGETVIKSGKSHSLILETKPFVVRKAGIYKFVVRIDGKEELENTFEIRIQNTP